MKRQENIRKQEWKKRQKLYEYKIAKEGRIE